MSLGAAVRPGRLGAEVVAAVPARDSGTVAGVVLLGEELAVSSLGNAVLGEHESVEEVALARVVAEPAQDGVDDAGLDVDGVLGGGVGGADAHVEDSLEELLAQAGARVVVDTRAVLGVGPSRRSGGRGVVGLCVAVGASNHDTKSGASLARVRSSGGVDARSPERALEVGERGHIVTGAGALVRVERRVTLNVQVEGGAQVGAVALGRAAGDVVALESVQSHVAVGIDRGVQVLESLSVAGRGDGTLSQLVVDGVGLEGGSRVRVGRRGPVSIRLRSTRVFGVDEAAVGSDLIGSRAGRVRSESVGVSPADGSTGGWDNDPGGHDGAGDDRRRCDSLGCSRGSGCSCCRLAGSGAGSRGCLLGAGRVTAR
jgi:hypothetical protein